MSAHPRLSILIPTAGEGSGLPRLLGSLSRVSGRSELETLLVDNGSTHPGLADLCARHGVVRVPCVEPGLARAREAGVASARAGVVLFLDDDTEWEAGEPGEVAGVFDRHPRLGALGLGVRNELEAGLRGRWGWMQHLVAETVHGRAWRRIRPQGGAGIAGAALAVRRQAWIEAGCGRTQLAGDYGTHPIRGEDLEAQFLLMKAGWQVWACPSWTVKHHPKTSRFTLRRLAEVCYWSCAGGAVARRLCFGGRWWMAEEAGDMFRLWLKARANRSGRESALVQRAMAEGVLDGLLRPGRTRSSRHAPEWIRGLADT